MVLPNADQDLLGIAVHEPLEMMDIPDYALKPMPAEKRSSRTLRWVLHVVTYDLGSDRHTLLLLDLSVLLVPQQSQPPEPEPSDTDFCEPNSPMNSANEQTRQEEIHA